ncbi:MAG TPA: ATP-binding protein [Thermoanaerobaculia bacterium]
MSTNPRPAAASSLEAEDEALRRSEARYRALAEATAQAVWVWDPSTGVGDFDATQRWWEKITGQSPAEQGGFDWQGWIEAVHPDDRELARTAWVTSMSTGAPFEVEYRVQTQDGGLRTILSRAVPVYGPEGEVREWVGTLADVTVQRQAMEELREADRRKDEFLAMLAHELRNPLAPIRTAVEVLRMVGPADPPVQQARGMIERQVMHMARLVDDLLDVSRISRGKILLRKERLDLVPLVRAAAEDHRSLIEANRLTLAAELPDQPVWVAGDPTRLSQVLGNLLQNSNKFTNPGGRVTIRLTEDGDEGIAVLAVEDTGIGMEPGMLARLFEPFSQADRSLDRSRGGLGLGLALVKGLTELHSGSVQASSAGRGRGTRITIQLPLSPQPAVEAGTGFLSQSPARSLWILVVEDNRDAAESLQMLLEIYGHQVVVAETGQAGLEAARQHRPDVAICDIGLPGGMDGYALARLLRRADETAGIYLIALSGYGQEEDRRQARQAGFDQHLTKPVDPLTLAKLLETLPLPSGV